MLYLSSTSNEFREVFNSHIGGLVQDCNNSSVLAMELLQSCTKPSIWCVHKVTVLWYSLCQKLDIESVLPMWSHHLKCLNQTTTGRRLCISLLKLRYHENWFGELTENSKTPPLKICCFTYLFTQYIWLYKTKHNDRPKLILCMGSANERRRCIATLSLIGWAHSRNYPCGCESYWANFQPSANIENIESLTSEHNHLIDIIFV